MRMSRFVPVVAAGALVAATVSPASAAEPGVGSTTATLEAVGVDVGELLSLSLLTDSGLADTNPAEGAVSRAAAQLNALEVVSELAGVELTAPVATAESTGDEVVTSQPGAAIPANPAISGTVLPVDLTALVGADGAASSIGAGIADLAILEGILGLTSTDLGLGATSSGAEAVGDRTVGLDGLAVLDLEALLAGLGIPLADLPLADVLALVDSLGLTEQLDTALGGLDLAGTDLTELSVDNIGDAATQLNTQVDTVQGAIEELSGDCTLADPDLVGLGGLLGATVEELCAAVETSLADANELLDVLQELIDSALNTVLDTLAGLSLLSVDAVEVGTTTKATDSVETSVADVEAAIRGLTVANESLGDIDVLGATQELTDTVNSTLNGILATAGLEGTGLENLISVSLLEEVTSVTEEDGAISADAVFTALGVEVAVPDLTALTTLLDTLGGEDSISGLLGEAGLPVPTTALDDVTALLPAEATALFEQGVSLRAGTLTQNSTHVLGATTTPQAPAEPQLPMTGSSDTLWLFMAAVAAAGALGLRRLTVRSDS